MTEWPKRTFDTSSVGVAVQSTFGSVEAARTADDSTNTTADVRDVALMTVIALLVIDMDVTIWSLPMGSNNHYLRVGISAYHFPLAVLVVLTVWAVAKRHRPMPTKRTALVMATSAWLIVAVLASPTWRGLDFLLHLAAAAAIWHTFASSTKAARGRLLVALVALGVFEAILGFAQFLYGGHIGLDYVEAITHPETVQSTFIPQGSFTHQYHFVGLVLLCTAATFTALRQGSKVDSRPLMIAALLPLGAAVPLTQSRTAVLAVVPMLTLLVIMRRHLPKWSIAVWVAGLSIGVALAAEGLLGRVERLTSGASQSFDSGRIELMREALDVVDRHPVVGVGPGNYVADLRNFLGVADDPSTGVSSAHNVIVHAAAEAGVLGGILVTASIVALLAWSIKGRPMRMIVILSLLPFQLLDRFPYTLQAGIVMSGVWLGVAHVAGEAPNHNGDTWRADDAAIG